MSKFMAKKCVCAQGHRHDSLAEGKYCDRLFVLMRAHEDGIIHVDVHPVVTLPGNIRWKLDFLIWSNRLSGFAASHGIAAPHLEARFVDVKGHETAEFKLKRKLFDSTHPAAPLLVVRRKGKCWQNI